MSDEVDELFDESASDEAIDDEEYEGEIEDDLTTALDWDDD